MIKFSQSTINNIYLGNTNINKVYFGSKLIFEKENIQQVLYEFTKGSETIYNTIEDSVKSAILKGSTKYRDIDTGEFLETFEEGRNLELVSVKMPVLTTTGKNTLNPNEITFDSSSAANPESYTYSEGVYTFKNSRSNNQMRFTITKQNASDKILYEVLEVKDLNGNVTPHQIVMEGSNDRACWFSIIRPGWVNVGEVKIKLGVDSLEPYKSNILTVNEDVTLRSNGDIRDELNLLTGQLTQRIGEDSNILDQEIVRTVNLIITDQDGNNVSTLKTFNDITHIIVKSNTNVLPTVKIGVAFNSNSVQAVSDAQNTISSEQYNIEEKINNQSQDTETTMIGTTEIYEKL